MFFERACALDMARVRAHCTCIHSIMGCVEGKWMRAVRMQALAPPTLHSDGIAQAAAWTVAPSGSWLEKGPYIAHVQHHGFLYGYSMVL